MTAEVVHRKLAHARASLARRAYRDAHSACLEVLRLDPKRGEALMLLGVVAADHANHKKAVELLDRAAAMGAANHEVFALKARSHLALNQKEEALRAARQAVKGGLKDPFTADMVGVVMSRLGRHEEALPFYAHSVEAVPKKASYQYNYGAALQFVGKIGEARGAYWAAYQGDEPDLRGLAAYVQLTKQTEQAHQLEELKAAFAAHQDDPDQALLLGHALSKAYEDLGQPDQALAWLDRAKEAKRKALDYTFDEDAALFKAARRVASSFSLTSSSTFEDTGDDGPIFVVGLPRSGTTLVDRILSAHPAVTSVGELSDFSVLLKRAVGTTSSYVLDARTLEAEPSDPEALGRAYVERVRKTLGVKGRFLDKMPLNVFFVPRILQAIPNARIICLRRHPADVMLSNYRQLFATSFRYYHYAYDLESTARYVAAFFKLIDHYKEVLPVSSFTDVQYEAVVEDLEGEARRLCAFCGIAFDPACLDFHQAAAPVATASSLQVRRPLYRSSMDRWKRYRPGIDYALHVLQQEGVLPAPFDEDS